MSLGAFQLFICSPPPVYPLNQRREPQNFSFEPSGLSNVSFKEGFLGIFHCLRLNIGAEYVVLMVCTQRIIDCILLISQPRGLVTIIM